MSVAIALVSSFFVSTATFSLGGTSALVVSFLIVGVVMSSFIELSLGPFVVTLWSPVVFVVLSSDSEDFLLFSGGFTFHALDVPCAVFEVGRFHPLDFFDDVATVLTFQLFDDLGVLFPGGGSLDSEDPFVLSSSFLFVPDILVDDDGGVSFFR